MCAVDALRLPRSFGFFLSRALALHTTQTTEKDDSAASASEDEGDSSPASALSAEAVAARCELLTLQLQYDSLLDASQAKDRELEDLRRQHRNLKRAFGALQERYDVDTARLSERRQCVEDHFQRLLAKESEEQQRHTVRAKARQEQASKRVSQLASDLKQAQHSLAAAKASLVSEAQSAQSHLQEALQQLQDDMQRRQQLELDALQQRHDASLHKIRTSASVPVCCVLCCVHVLCACAVCFVLRVGLTEQ